MGEPDEDRRAQRKGPPPDRRLWLPALAGAALGVGLGGAPVSTPLARPVVLGLATLPLAAGAGLGYGLLRRHRQQQVRRLLALQSETIRYSKARRLVGHRMAGGAEAGPSFEGHQVPLDAEASGSAKAALTGRPVLVDDALKYLDAVVQGIREGAERTRKIVRDRRVFARTARAR